MKTPEQEARDILERMEIDGAQSFSAGELVELADLISDARMLRNATSVINDHAYQIDRYKARMKRGVDIFVADTSDMYHGKG